MRVLTETPDELVVEDRPWLLAGIYVAFAVLGASGAIYAVQAGEPEKALVPAVFLILGVFGVHRVVRVLRLTIDRDGTATIATWRGRRWRSRTHAPGTTWARMIVARTRGWSRHGVVLDVTGANGSTEDLMYPIPFGYARAAEAVRRINLHLREPVIDPEHEQTGPQRWLQLDRKPRRR